MNVFAGLLLLAAAAKFLVLANQPSPLRTWREFLSFSQIAGECVIAAWIISGLGRLWARRISVGLLAVFAAVSAWNWAAGHQNCGCFGDLHVHPAVTFGLDLLALLLIWKLGATPREPARQRRSSLRLWLAGLIALALPAAVVWTLHPVGARAAGEEVIVFDADTAPGKPLELLIYLEPDSLARVPQGRATIILFNRDCSHCQEYLTQLASTRPEKTWAIDLAEQGTAGGFRCPFPQLRLSGKAQVFAEVPIEIVLVDGIVQEAKGR